MNFILQFNFETGDASCNFYQVYAIVKSDTFIDHASLEDSIMSYFEGNVVIDDLEYEDMVEDIMRESGLVWEFMKTPIPESERIYSFWI